MILVKVSTTTKAKTQVEVSGHAEYDTKGKDVVCAAVSALVQGAVVGLKKVLNEKVKIKKSEGFLKFEVARNDKTEIIIMTLVESLKDLSSQYPSYIKMED